MFNQLKETVECTANKTQEDKKNTYILKLKNSVGKKKINKIRIKGTFLNILKVIYHSKHTSWRKTKSLTSNIRHKTRFPILNTFI